jgi:hypothetical protein
MHGFFADGWLDFSKGHTVYQSKIAWLARSHLIKSRHGAISRTNWICVTWKLMSDRITFNVVSGQFASLGLDKLGSS